MDFVKLLITRQPFRTRLQMLLNLCFRRLVRRCRHNYSVNRYVRPVLGRDTDNTYLRDRRTLPIECLQFNRIDILPGGRHNDVFAVPCKIEITIFVHISEITRVEPPISDRLLCRIGIPIIPFHGTRSLCDNFTDTFAVWIFNLDFHAFHRRADRSASAL